jgi:hypothetical protein
VVTYKAIHKRLRRLRGRASDHACVGCGGQAQEWSYDHNDLNEVQGVHRGRPVAVSDDPMHYQPRCSSCHRYYDMAVIETRRAL